jgi:hypothetical protein
MRAPASRKSAATGGVQIPVNQQNSKKFERYLTTFRVAKIETQQGTGLGIVRNISSEGMVIEMAPVPSVGDPISISFFDGYRFEARAIWNDDVKVGVKLTHPVEVHDLLAVPGPRDINELPRRPRIRVDRNAVIDIDYKLDKVQLWDLSQHGAKLYSNNDLCMLQDLWLWIDGIRPVRATVRWTKDSFVGVAFHKMLSVEDLSAILHSPPTAEDEIGQQIQNEPPFRLVSWRTILALFEFAKIKQQELRRGVATATAKAPLPSEPGKTMHAANNGAKWQQGHRVADEF